MIPRRAPAPWLLAGSSRWAGLPRRTALVRAALAAMLAIAAGIAVAGRVAPNGDPALVVQAGIVAGLRHGGSYYPVAADALREVGASPRAAPLPTLARVAAILPRWAPIAGLWWLAAGVALAWWARLAAMLPGTPARAAAVPLLAAGMAMLVRPDLVLLPEPWAGLLLALAIARRRPGRWGEAAATALAAALVCDVAGIALAVMLAAAWREGEPAEARGWFAAIAVFAVVMGLHEHALAPLAGVLPGAPGIPATLASLAGATALVMLPAALALPVLVLALVGWASWRDPLAVRVAGVVAATLAVLAVSGGEPSPWRVLVVAPLLPLGLVALPDAGREALRAALDTRRIVVRRAVR